MSEKQHDNYIPALSYDFLTPLYDPVVRLTSREKTFKRKLTQQVNLQPGQRALDLGCGTATLTIALQQSCTRAEVFGLDGDAKILELARRKTEKADLKITLDQGMSYRMSYADEFFHKAVSSLFFHHLSTENKTKTLDEIFRVLRIGGSLHVADWGKPSNFSMRMASRSIEWFDGASTADSFQGKLPKLMAAGGFTEIVETAAVNTIFGTIRLHQAKKK